MRRLSYWRLNNRLNRDPAGRTRQKVVHYLSHLASNGDHHVISLSLPRLNDWHCGVRSEVDAVLQEAATTVALYLPRYVLDFTASLRVGNKIN